MDPCSIKETQLKRPRCNQITPLLFILCIFTVSMLMNLRTEDPKRLWEHIVPRTTEATSTSVLEITRIPPSTRHPLAPPYPFDYKFILNQPDKCKGKAPFLVILVIVNSNDIEARHAIRRTWGNESNVPGVSIARLFLTGVPPKFTAVIQKMLEEESDVYQDIIQQDFLDTYNNLTLKTLMGMEWVSKHCPNASYVMKIDSDMFFNAHFLVNNLLKPELPVRTDYMSCHIVSNTGPMRSKAYKWYVPKEVYPRDTYPPYCSGPGYLFSGDLAKKIHDVAQTIPVINMEDSFIGICMDELKIELTKPPANVFNGHQIEYDPCRFSNLITVHHYSPQRLLEIWPDFQSRNESECLTKT